MDVHNVETLNKVTLKRKTKEKFIEEAELVHGDEYDYSLVEYVDTHTNISIICKKRWTW